MGSQGSKGHFHKKCSNSSILYRMTMRLMHVHQLKTLYLCNWVNCQSGVIWGHWGQKVIFTKNAITRPCYIAWPKDSYMLITLRPSTYFIGSIVNLLLFWVTGVKSWFSKKCNNLFMLHSITIRLTHVHQLKTLSTYVVGLYFNLGSFGVTGFKRSFSLKMQ